MWTKISEYLILHPIIFAIFPILSLYTNNIEEVAFASIVRSLIISLLGMVAILLFWYVVIRDLNKAAVLTTFFLILFFTYGHLYTFLKVDLGLDASIVRHRYLVVIYTGLFFAGTFLILKVFNETNHRMGWLNLLGMGLLVYPMIKIIDFNSKVSEDILISEYLIPNSVPLEIQILNDLPDIYYIILDTYTRADAMKKELGYDTADFLNQLKGMDFFIAECSRSNYASTHESLASSLNMNYLSDLKYLLTQQGLGADDVWLLIRHSLVREMLEKVGYRTVAFDTGYEWSRLNDAEIYLTLYSSPIHAQFLEPFELLQLKTSAGLLLVDYWINSSSMRKQSLFQNVDSVQIKHGEFIKRQLFILDILPDIASYPGHKFVFVHLLIPHVPRVFGPNGEILADPGFYDGDLDGAINEEYDIKGYLNEVQFINSQILEISKEIIAKSKTPPIIIIQGDTGKSGQNIVEILNAYYTRGETNSSLYPSISPVNTFRVILNSYFGAKFDILPDESRRDGEIVFERWAACKEN